MNEHDTGPIRAAGGIISGVGKNKGKIAVIHRRRYAGEIALPKGKLREGENEKEAALREVEEETGIKPVLRDVAGSTQYNVGGSPKTVTYFLMEALDDKPTQPKDSGEVGSVEWMTPADAIARLSHAEDKDLIRRIFADQLRGGAGARCRLGRWFNGTPDRARLDAAIRDAAIELADAEGSQGRWRRSAERHLAQARSYLADENLQQGWSSLNSANRLILLDKGDPQALQLAAVELVRETKKKLSGWRGEAISDLICDEKGKVLPNIGQEPMRVIHAQAIRDNQFETDYFKIILRRWHLQQLFLLLAACILATLAVCYFLPPPFNDVKLIVAVLLFGAMGAALSVARGLIKADLSAKIPTQKIGSFVIWMRPAIGATAALVSFVLLNSKAIRILNWDPTDPTVILTIATVSGFSERFIVGAIEKIGDGTDASGQK